MMCSDGCGVWGVFALRDRYFLRAGSTSPLETTTTLKLEPPPNDAIWVWVCPTQIGLPKYLGTVERCSVQGGEDA